MTRKWKTSMIMVLLLLPFTCHANTFKDKLQQVVSQIHVTKKNLSESEKKHHKIQESLKKHDTNIGSLSKKIATTQNELEQLKNQLEDLNKQQVNLQETIDENRFALSDQIKSAYLQGNKNTLKMLLNQENPNDFDRMVTYHKIIGQKRFELISELKQAINKINTNKQQINKKSKRLVAIQKQLKIQQKAMYLNHKKRREVLHTLSRTIKTHRQKLTELDNNKNQLEKTLSRLKTNKAKGSEYFTAHRHKLPWPTKGKVAVSFGTRIQDSHLKWSGILMKAKEGARVTAIAPGKVVFSDWMPGFGLLLILDHGDGYMSLYGRNNSLYRSTGDWVKAGDLIASVGMSGGHSKPALYFSLRHKGKPMDPMEWCTTTGQAA